MVIAERVRKERNRGVRRIPGLFETIMQRWGRKEGEVLCLRALVQFKQNRTGMHFCFIKKIHLKKALRGKYKSKVQILTNVVLNLEIFQKK